jgi:hypothetical protein
VEVSVVDERKLAPEEDTITLPVVDVVDIPDDLAVDPIDIDDDTAWPVML